MKMIKLPFVNLLKNYVVTKNEKINNTQYLLHIKFIKKMCYNRSSGDFSPEIGDEILQYEGTIEKGKFHGQGQLEFTNGEMYSGTFKNGIFINGTSVDPYGKKISGRFLYGKYPYGIMYVEEYHKAYFEYFFGFELPFLKFKKYIAKKLNKNKAKYTKLTTIEHLKKD